LSLSQVERETLLEVAESLVKEGSLSGLAAYGSKVAGYARSDSDYDILVVSPNYKEGVRYRYVHGPFEASALVLDESFLMRDASSSFLGEFVAGRFLNVYEPITNPTLFRKAEVEYKKRVIVDELVELSSDYGSFCGQLRIPYDYFLFSKLKKRAMVYPPALYSYVQTYTCPSAPENRAASVSGFAQAAKELSPRGFLIAEEDHVRVVPAKMQGDAFTKFSSLFSQTARSVTQYAVHGYAGRVGLGIVKKEASSKLKRMQERRAPPVELEKPKSLLKLEEGVVVPSASEMNGQLAKIAGFPKFSVRERSLGETYTTAKVVTVSDGSSERSFFVKNFSDVMSLKWAFLGVWAASARKFSMTPIARLDREYTACRALRRLGVDTPTVVAVSPDERIMALDFIEGPNLASIVDGMFRGEGSGTGAVREYGGVMAKAHSGGMSIGDAKASNVIVSERGLFLTDLEQSVRGGDTAWDVAEFLYFTAKLSSKEAVMQSLADAFLEGYSEHGDKSVIGRARVSKYLAPFRPFLTPGMIRTVREQLDRHS